jgi:hypothetical protein
MPRAGLRPHTWKVQGEIPHNQYLAWLKMKAQADFRGEPWQFAFEDFQQVWGAMWHRKGRGKDDYCLTRTNIQLPWHLNNVECIPRIDHLRRSQQRKKEMRQNGKYTRRSSTL